MTAEQSRSRFPIGPEERFLIIGLVVVVVLVLVLLGSPTLGERLSAFSRSWQETAIRYGYIGAFASALIGNATVLIVFPYTAIIFFLAAFGLNPVLLGLATGLGATLGELVSYAVARTGSGAFSRKRPESYAAVRAIVERRPRLIPILLVIFAALPLPDDLLLIPLGIVRYPVWRVFIPTLAGKIVAALAIALTGRQANALVFTERTATGDVLVNGAILLVIIIGLYLFFKIRWNDVLNRFVPPAPPPGSPG